MVQCAALEAIPHVSPGYPGINARRPQRFYFLVYDITCNICRIIRDDDLEPILRVVEILQSVECSPNDELLVERSYQHTNNRLIVQ